MDYFNLLLLAFMIRDYQRVNINYNSRLVQEYSILKNQELYKYFVYNFTS